MAKPIRSILIVTSLVLLCVAGAAGVFGYYAFQGSKDGESLAVLIPRGTTLNQVTRTLADAGVVTRPKVFNWLLRLTHGSSKMRAGEFTFQKRMSPMSAMQVLYAGEPILHAVTIPEGWTVRQIAKALADAELVNEQEFVDLALSPQAPKKYQLQTPTLEGFLFPETYHFSKVDGEAKILDHMVNSFFEKFNAELRAEAKAKGWTLENLVTLASIIEKETGALGERELVSSVFHNRLKKKMRLQSDPTTIYGIADFNGNLTKDDLKRYSPYNTYVIPALPPGPIASPGLASLTAAMRPAQTDYFYFVASKARGEHIFSKDYGAHARHVQSHQKRGLSHEIRRKKR